MKATRNIGAILILILIVVGCKHKTTQEVIMDPCVINLQVIKSAEEAWAKDHGKTSNDVPVMADLEIYIETPAKTCPAGGTYTLGPVWKGPTCSIKGHELPASNAH
jgi:hypothetical protein